MQIIQAKATAGSSESGNSVRDERLERSAHAFEASLMAELLKPLEQNTGAAEASGEEGSGDALAGFAVESLARVISDRGGFGIANRVLHSLEGHSAVLKTPLRS